MKEVGAIEKTKIERSEPQIVHIDVHVGVFFDGTNNNANVNKWYDWFKLNYYVERDHAYNNRIPLKRLKKNSNPAILSSLFISGDKNFDPDKDCSDKYLHVYIEGSGANGFHAENDYLEMAIHGKPVKGLGFGVGPTGVVAKVSKAIKYVSEKIKAEEDNNLTVIDNIHFYVFGFSRGSACARLFSFLVARSAGDTSDKLKREEEFDEYLSGKYFKKGMVHFLDNYKGRLTVDFLGIYDTVSAIGFLKDKDDNVNWMRYAFMGDRNFWGNFHKENAKDYGLYSPSLPSVLSTCHICALDEYRANFALTDIGNTIPSDSIELYLPGCHSDIGGGYTQESEKEVKTLDKDCDDKPSRILTSMDWKYVSKETLIGMGWGDSSEIIDKKNSVDIEHQPKPEHVYSNIPLRFMLERAKQKAPKLKKLFGALIDEDSGNDNNSYDYPVPPDSALQTMWTVLNNNIDATGRYIYVLPESDYRNIRLNYLHFTSTDALHSAGDVGNVPGRDSSGEFSDIKRLLYHGGLADSSDVYYLQDLIG